jgi:hypothetical protein
MNVNATGHASLPPCSRALAVPDGEATRNDGLAIAKPCAGWQGS